MSDMKTRSEELAFEACRVYPNKGSGGFNNPQLIYLELCEAANVEPLYSLRLNRAGDAIDIFEAIDDETQMSENLALISARDFAAEYLVRKLTHRVMRMADELYMSRCGCKGIIPKHKITCAPPMERGAVTITISWRNLYEDTF